ncbi:MAG: flagellar hook-length control protein FliK [Melioribacteraceae bacterium]|nr:flagellar hook-length control protein FliK [Melioribacteraceae bacterium]
MNLNPLFFNKLNIEADLTKSNSSLNGTQTYLFADIINISREGIATDEINVQSSTIDLLLASINDLEIDILVSEEQINELKKIINNPTFLSENSSKDLYHLENTDIIKTRQLISEPELSLFITGINQIISNYIQETSLDFSSPENELTVDPEVSDIELSLPTEVLTLDIVRSALQNHDQLKLTFKSGTEKITYQISNPEVIKSIPLTNEPGTLFQQIAPELVEPNNPEITQPTVKDGLVNTKKVEENQENIISYSKFVEKNFSYNATIQPPEDDVKEETDHSNNNSGKVYKIEGYYSESRNSNAGSGNGIKTPFILDINTSKEIGMFLNKYNFEKELMPKSADVSGNPQLKPDTNQLSNEIIKETEGITNISDKESRLYLVNSEELNKDIDTKYSYTLKKDSSEYLRSIKIETGNTINSENNNVTVDKVVANEKNNDSSLLSKIVTNETLKTDNPVKIETETKKIIIDVAKESSLKNVKQPNVIVEIEKLESISNEENANKAVKESNQTEQIKNIRQFDINIISGKSIENSTLKNRLSNKVNDSEVIADSVDSSMVESPKSVKGDPDITKEFRNTDSNVNLNTTYSNSTDLQKENDSEVEKDNSQDKKAQTINSKISEESENQDSKTGLVKESVKQTEFQNHSEFNKKIDQVDKLTHKIVSDASAFTETVKKVKSSEVVSEINKYLLSNEKQSVTFQLTPKNLGTVKLIVDYVDNQLSANIEVENEQVKQTVQSNLDQLRNTLQNNGIQLSNINVSLSNGEPKAQKQFSQKRKNFGGSSELKVGQKNDLSGKKKMGYNTYEYLA